MEPIYNLSEIRRFHRCLISNAELASQICSGIQDNDAIDKLAEEIKEWMIKRVEDEIKDSGL